MFIIYYMILLVKGNYFCEMLFDIFLIYINKVNKIKMFFLILMFVYIILDRFKYEKLNILVLIFELLL